MMKYDGYTKTKENGRYVERHIYKCTEYGKEVRITVDRLPVSTQAPNHCPKCGKA